MQDSTPDIKVVSEPCRCCRGETAFFSTAKVLEFEAIYLKCFDCSSIQVANPYWIGDAHSNAISDLDTGLVSRCVSASRLTSTLLWLEGKGFAKGIDWGGGTGLLTRLLRDQGFQVHSYDKYENGGHSRGFNTTLEGTEESAVFITAIECFEHLIDPISAFKNAVLKKDYFIFTTDIISTPPPDPAEMSWWYFMPESGQHITFASKQGIEEFKKILGFGNYLQIGTLHVMSRSPLRLRTRLILLRRFLRGTAIILIPEILNRKYSLAQADKEKLTPSRAP